jgi:RNA polymerase sigma-70 factor, ECF subfamily
LSEEFDTRLRNGAPLREELGELVTRNGERWLAFARRLVHDPADAEDVLHDVVERVLERRRCFEDRDELGRYVTGAIRNRAIEFYRRRTRAKRHYLPVADNLLLDIATADATAQIERRENHEERTRVLRLVREGLSRLPPKQYDALRRTVIEGEGMSIRDTCVGSGIPYSTLRHRRLRGLRQLRHFLRRSHRPSRCGN